MNTVEACRNAPLPEQVASHFNDVDDAQETRLGLFPFMAAGLRIVDLRDPSRPVEIAYYKPGLARPTVLEGLGLSSGKDHGPDPCMSDVRYVRETGQIWFACMASGFHVIELTPELRKAVGLPPLGKPGRGRR